jgi:hypothetical protein
VVHTGGGAWCNPPLYDRICSTKTMQLGASVIFVNKAPPYPLDNLGDYYYHWFSSGVPPEVRNWCATDNTENTILTTN